MSTVPLSSMSAAVSEKLFGFSPRRRDNQATVRSFLLGGIGNAVHPSEGLPVLLVSHDNSPKEFSSASMVTVAPFARLSPRYWNSKPWARPPVTARSASTIAMSNRLSIYIILRCSIYFIGLRLLLLYKGTKKAELPKQLHAKKTKSSTIWLLSNFFLVILRWRK